MECVRSARKTVALEVCADGHLVVRAPLTMDASEICRFVESKRHWIEEKRTMLAQAQSDWGGAVLTKEEVAQIKFQAQEDLSTRVEHWAPQVGVQVARVDIRMPRKRWGSCSAKGRLSFNAMLMLAPSEVRDYVVVHELCHLKEMNHSPNFWAEVEQVVPTYRQAAAWLKTNGHALLQRIPT